MTAPTKRPVHRFWLMSIWSSVGEGPHTDRLASVDVGAPEGLRLIVDGYLRPYFKGLPHDVRAKIIDAWRYGLHCWTDEDLRRGLQRVLPPFKTPDDIRAFYIETWKMLFGDEPWEITDANAYEEVKERISSPWGVVGHVRG